MGHTGSCGIGTCKTKHDMITSTGGLSCNQWCLTVRMFFPVTLSEKPRGQSVIKTEKFGVGHIGNVTIREHFNYFILSKTTKLGMCLFEDMGLLESVTGW